LISVNGRSWRCQEILPRDVLSFLGTIPISRSYIENKVAPGASLNKLIVDFRALEATFAAKPN